MLCHTDLAALGPLIAGNLRRRWSPPSGRWHLDEMAVKIGDQRMLLWRAIDDGCALTEERRSA
jgi:transposase-like protein